MPRPPLMADETWSKSEKGNLYTTRYDGAHVVIFQRSDGRYGIVTRSEEWGTVYCRKHFASPRDVKRYAEREVLDLGE
jgi:hypothetical protein